MVKMPDGVNLVRFILGTCLFIRDNLHFNVAHTKIHTTILPKYQQHNNKIFLLYTLM